MMVVVVMMVMMGQILRPFHGGRGLRPPEHEAD